MFVQVIQGKINDPAALRKHMDTWMSELSGGAEGWLGTTAGVTDDGTSIALVRFEDEASARRNSDRPEQGQWWAEAEKLFDGGATFSDSDRVETDVHGDPESAGFVQVMQGGSTDPERAWQLMQEDSTDWSSFRPDILATVSVGHPDGRWTMCSYFTSEAEAREGEQKEPPPELAKQMQELMTLSDGEPTYFDIREPWYYSPR